MNRTHYHYPGSIRFGKLFLLVLSLFLSSLTFILVAQNVFSKFPKLLVTTCDKPGLTCEIPLLVVLVVSILFLFLFINAYPSVETGANGITVYFFPRKVTLAWDECISTDVLHGRVFQWRIIYSKKLPWFCKVYGLLFFTLRRGFLISKQISDAKSLMTYVQSELKRPSTKINQKAGRIGKGYSKQ